MRNARALGGRGGRGGPACGGLEVPPELDTLATVDEIRACYAWAGRLVVEGKLHPKVAHELSGMLAGAARLLGRPSRDVGEGDGQGAELDPTKAAREAEARAAARRASRELGQADRGDEVGEDEDDKPEYDA
jgi:hypothetical protein